MLTFVFLMAIIIAVIIYLLYTENIVKNNFSTGYRKPSVVTGLPEILKPGCDDWLINYTDGLDYIPFDRNEKVKMEKCSKC